MRQPAAKTLPERDIAIKLNSDATFSFPYGDGYWSKLLNLAFKYEDELELLFRNSADVNYTLIDCGANYGYWSVMVSSSASARTRRLRWNRPRKNFAKPCATTPRSTATALSPMKCAIGEARGTARLSGTKHERSASRAERAGAKKCRCIALDNLLDDGKISADGKYLIKLDVEGVEIEAIKGGTRLLQGDSVILCEEHGNDPKHTVSRYILEETPLKLIVHDPAQQPLRDRDRSYNPRPHQGLEPHRIQCVRHRQRVLARTVLRR